MIFAVSVNSALKIPLRGLVGKDDFVAKRFDSLDQIDRQALGLEFIQIVVLDAAGGIVPKALKHHSFQNPAGDVIR